jgi:hypothetical protein
MNPRPIRIACHVALISLTLYVTDALLRTNNSVTSAMLLILGTLVLHLVRRLGLYARSGVCALSPRRSTRHPRSRPTARGVHRIARKVCKNTSRGKKVLVYGFR